HKHESEKSELDTKHEKEHSDLEKHFKESKEDLLSHLKGEDKEKISKLEDQRDEKESELAKDRNDRHDKASDDDLKDDIEVIKDDIEKLDKDYAEKREELDNKHEKDGESLKDKQDSESKHLDEKHHVEDVACDTHAVSGTAKFAINIGSDGWGNAHIEASGALTAKSDGHQLTYLASDDGQSLKAVTVDEQGHATDSVVFTVAMDQATSSYTVTVLQAIDPADGNKDVTLGFKLVATDADGDTAQVPFKVTIDANNDGQLNAADAANVNVFVGGAGNNILDGDVGPDVFKWSLADQGTTEHPAADVIKDFNVAPVANGGDVLDLKDLLSDDSTEASLVNHLHFTAVGGNTVVSVTPDGSGEVTQTITLENVNFSSLTSYTAGATADADIIHKLLANGNLKTDI
ncbi:MAG: hypothetical protein RJB64_1382, partial [Pseudomonadota bacterium]